MHVIYSKKINNTSNVKEHKLINQTAELLKELRLINRVTKNMVLIKNSNAGFQKFG